MEKVGHANSFTDLAVYQKAKSVPKAILEITKSFPKEEMYSLTDQVRRSSRSIGGEIAEAWGKRRYEKHFISKPSDADGEQQEAQHWIDTAADCEYLEKAQARKLNHDLSEIGCMLGSIINKSGLFCGQYTSSVDESTEQYLITDN